MNIHYIFQNTIGFKICSSLTTNSSKTIREKIHKSPPPDNFPDWKFYTIKRSLEDESDWFTPSNNHILESLTKFL